ncbi:MAG TPA: NAD(P)-dependent oxidoreductase [Limnochordales bacterium]
MPAAKPLGPVVAVAVLDTRAYYAACGLARRGAQVRCVGLLPPGREGPRLERWPDLARAAAGAEVVVGPLAGVCGLRYHPAGRDAGGAGPADLAPLFAGRSAAALVVLQAAPELRQAAGAAGWQLVELARDEAFLLQNAAITAEGALQLAMGRLSVTLHRSRAVVVGLGRCGQALAARLAALGAHVVAVAFNDVEQARAWCMGLSWGSPQKLPELVRGAQVVFNTAPAPVLSQEVLAAMPARCLVIDIASGAGGTDFEACRRLGRRCLHALGLPARTAPRTAGELVARRVWAWWRASARPGSTRHLLGDGQGA